MNAVDDLLKSSNPKLVDFTVEEALALADQNDTANRHVPSVSRTLAAEIRRLQTLVNEPKPVVQKQSHRWWHVIFKDKWGRTRTRKIAPTD